MSEFRIYMRNTNGKGKTFINMIKYPSVFTINEIKERLIKKENYPKNIIVRKYCFS